MNVERLIAELIGFANLLDYPKEEALVTEASAALAKLQAENERLNAALRYEQHREGRIGTHGPNCHTWGPQHYECALAKLEVAEAERDEAIAEIARRDAVAKASWGDQKDEYTPAIKAAHPTRTKRFEIWDRALAMIGKRHGKYELVDLTNWLLVRAEDAEAALKAKT